MGARPPIVPQSSKKSVVSEQDAKHPTIETGSIRKAEIHQHIQKGAVKLKTWQLLFYVPNLNWYQRQSFNLVCIANKPHHFEGQIEAKTCHENHSIF